MKESIYIFYRKLKAKLNSICFYIMRIFPIDKKLISIYTFEGKGGFGCNLKYIVQELHRQHPDLKFVWFVNDMNKKFPSYIGKVPNTLLSKAYWLSRSKVWIENSNIQDRIINENQEDDFYALLAGMDAYITDYSSACFEAGFARIPVFIYADDIEEYRHDRGALFWDITGNVRDNVSINQDIFLGMDIGFPFSISTTNDELEDNIKSFNSDKYSMRLEEFDKKRI